MRKADQALSTILYVYLIIVFWIIPLYLPAGYTGCGEKKSVLYIGCALILAAMSVPFAAVRIRSAEGNRHKGLLLLILAAVLSQILTFAFSEHKSAALFGTNGWRTGFVPQLLFLYFALLFMLFFRIDADVWYIIFLGETAVLGMGILNRLGFYPVPGTDIGMHYISTIGNTDWFATYLTVLYPLDLGLLMQIFSGKEFKARGKTDRFLKRLLIIAMVLSHANLVMLGSNSSVLIMITPLILFVIPLVQDRNIRFPAAFLLSAGAACEFAYLAGRINVTDRWNDVFTPDNPFTFMVRRHMGLALAAAGACLLVIDRKRERKAAGSRKKSKDLLFAPAILLLIIPVILLMAQLVRPAAFGDDLGNGRGFIWHIGSDVFKAQSSGDKVFGSGQDTFGIAVSEMAEEDPDGSLAAALAERFGSAKLTNAHSVLLNKTAETGAAGAAVYTMMIVCSGIIAIMSFITRRDHRKLALAASVICYFLFGSIYFEQVTAVSAAYVMIGLIGAENGK